MLNPKRRLRASDPPLNDLVAVTGVACVAIEYQGWVPGVRNARARAQARARARDQARRSESGDGA